MPAAAVALMSTVVIRCLAALLLAVTALLQPVTAEEITGRVVSVADGDTLTLLRGREQLRIRLTEIDAPERGQPFGRRSAQSLRELCAWRWQEKTCTSAAWAGSGAVAWMPTPSRSCAAWLGSTTITSPTVACTRCRRRCVPVAAACGPMRRPCHRGNGAGAYAPPRPPIHPRPA